MVVLAPAVRGDPEAVPHRRRVWWWVGLALVLTAARLSTFELWGDVRFTLGVERVTALTGWSATEVWAHRPLTDRLLMAGLDRLTGGELREQQLVGWGGLGAGLAVAALDHQLRPRLGSRESAGLCAGLLIALLWTSARNLLQPEWIATLTAVAAVAVAARPVVSRAGERAVVATAGLLLTATVLMKFTTVGTAAAGWAAIVALGWGQRRRLVGVTVATVVLTAVVLGVEVLLVPHEGRWLWEMPQLNPDPTTPSWCDLRGPTTAACPLAAMLANEAVVSPALLLLPAAVALLMRTSRGLAQVAVVLLPVVGLASAIATTALQAKWFGYHLVVVAVLAGTWLGWALARWSGRTGRPGWSLVGPALVAGPVVAAVLSRPVAVRTSTNVHWLGLPPAAATFLFGAGVAVAALVSALRASPQPGGALPLRAQILLGGAALAVMFVNPLDPRAGFSLNFQDAGRTAVTEHEKRAAAVALTDRIRDRIGAETPVVYLAFGERAYWLGNPTYCRYAAATFLQRSVWVPTRDLPSFAENLECLDDPRAAYVVVESDWFRFARTDPLVRQRLTAQFDCDRPVLQEPSARVCPRR